MYCELDVCRKQGRKVEKCCLSTWLTSFCLLARQVSAFCTAIAYLSSSSSFSSLRLSVPCCPALQPYYALLVAAAVTAAVAVVVAAAVAVVAAAVVAEAVAVAVAAVDLAAAVVTVVAAALAAVVATIATGAAEVARTKNQSTLRKPPPNLKSLSTFSHTPARIRTWAVVRDS